MAEAGHFSVLPGRRARRVMSEAALSGMLAALGQAPVSLPWASLVGFGFVFYLFVNAPRARGAAWIGWAFGAGYFAATLFWIVEPFFVDLARDGWMAPFALLGMSGGLAIFWGLAMGAAHWLAPGGGWRGALAWAACLSIAELARSYVLTGFPWALIGHVWIGWGPMQLAAVTGPIGLTLLTLLAVALVMVAFSRRRVLALAMLVPFAALYGAGVWLGAQPVPDAGERPVVRLIQPNAAQRLKWDPDYAPVFFARQLEFTAAPAVRKPDLIIWPETSVPTILNRAGPAFARIAEAAAGAPVVLGIQRFDSAKAYNSLVALDGTGAVTDVYDKAHLVPFGEYIPLAWLLGYTPLAGIVGDQGYGYTPGPGARVLDLGPLGKMLPLICYEAIFPQDLNAAPERPDWLVQITNDAWFGQISGPYQHLAQARLRAVEQGLPMLRAANTGVSAVIDARGRVTVELGLGQAGYVDADLPPPLGETIYARTGDWAMSAVLLLLVLLLAARRGRYRH